MLLSLFHLIKQLDSQGKQVFLEKAAEPAYEQDTAYKSNAPDSDQYHLDSCIVRTEPPMKEESEHLMLPERLMEELGLEGSHSADGAIIAGKWSHRFKSLHRLEYQDAGCVWGL